MIVNNETILKMSPSEIRGHYRQDGHFFDRETMKFFGDTMRSFGVVTVDGARYLYRRRGRFACWRVEPLDTESLDLRPVVDDDPIWRHLTGRSFRVYGYDNIVRA